MSMKRYKPFKCYLEEYDDHKDKCRIKDSKTNKIIIIATKNINLKQHLLRFFDAVKTISKAVYDEPENFYNCNSDNEYIYVYGNVILETSDAITIKDNENLIYTMMDKNIESGYDFNFDFDKDEYIKESTTLDDILN